jgi:hypothetical protein
MTSTERDEAVAAIVALFTERSAYWSQRGYHGAQLYEMLACDPALPENFDPAVIAAILHVKPDALAQRRKRGGGPSFLRPSKISVIYPRAQFCLFLRDRFVERRTPRAQSEYTTVSHA